MVGELTSWMAWEGGVDLCAATEPGLAQPNLLVHVARLVQTPVGAAPAGMVLYQPDPAKPPELVGFIAHDEEVGRYFGPRIFAGTPFESAPVHKAHIDVYTNLPAAVGAKIEVAGLRLETRLSRLGPLGLVSRAPGGATPFHQQGLESVAAVATLSVGGKAVDLHLPEVGISGGPPAVWAPTGIYAR